MNDVLEVPANDERAAIDRGDSDMQRIISRLLRDNSCFQVGVFQVKRLLGNFDHIDDLEKLVEQIPNLFRRRLDLILHQR